MIAGVMSYALAVSLLVSASGYAFERCATWLGAPRRGVWFVAMCVSLCVTGWAFSQGGSPERHTLTTPAAAAPIDAVLRQAHAALSWMPSPSWPIWREGDLILLCLWATASAALAVAMIVAYWRLHRQLRHWPTMVLERQTVFVATDVGPAVFGVVCPRIILPVWLLERASSVREAALRHEQAHVAAGDGLMLALALALVVVAPWNLALWLQLRRLRFAIEVDCDTRVLRSGMSASDYGEALLAVAQQRDFPPFTAVSLGASASQLERRIGIMLIKRNRRLALTGVCLLALGIAPAAFGVSLPPPVLHASQPSGENPGAISFSSDRVESSEHGQVLVLTGHVRIEAPPQTSIGYDADQITRRSDGAELLEGGVMLSLAGTSVAADTALITPSAAGSVITTDRAEVTQTRTSQH